MLGGTGGRSCPACQPRQRTGSGQGADREKQVQERALSMCLGGRERGLRGQQGAGRGGCLLRAGLLASLFPAVLWEERNKAG